MPQSKGDVAFQGWFSRLMAAAREGQDYNFVACEVQDNYKEMCPQEAHYEYKGTKCCHRHAEEALWNEALDSEDMIVLADQIEQAG